MSEVHSSNSCSRAKFLFLQACERNDLEKVRHYLDLGANVNWKGNDYYERSGLHLAAVNNYEELLELLLSQPGVDVNITDKRNETPLMVACDRGHENIVRRLCQVNGIDPNIRNDGGYTALHLAVGNYRPRNVEILRTLPNVDWNVRNDGGHYPLTAAVMRGYADVLQILLSVPHLDLSVTDGRGRTVAQIAVDWGGGQRQRCVEILSRERGVNWNIKNSDGDTPVMFCLKNNKIEMARCLINTPGVDLDTVDRDGKNLETIARENLNILSLVFRTNTKNIVDGVPECPVSLNDTSSCNCYVRFVLRGSVVSLRCSSVTRATLCVETADQGSRSVPCAEEKCSR